MTLSTLRSKPLWVDAVSVLTKAPTGRSSSRRYVLPEDARAILFGCPSPETLRQAHTLEGSAEILYSNSIARFSARPTLEPALICAADPAAKTNIRQLMVGAVVDV